MEISNWRTNKFPINLCNIPRCGDVSLEEGLASCFPIELHVSLVFVQPVNYQFDTFLPHSTGPSLGPTCQVHLIYVVESENVK